MDKYITNFTTTEEFNALRFNLKRPHVSLTKDNMKVHYMYDYSDMYLTFDALESGTISFNILKDMGTDMITSISYSTDNGETWTTTNNYNDKSENLEISVDVNEGDRIMWKGNSEQLGYYDEYLDEFVGSFFSSDCEFNTRGNIMSLLYEDNFSEKTELTKDGTFCNLFSSYDGESECKVVNASNLILPATTLAYGCYWFMFQGCTTLATTPELPATILVKRCYTGMFQGCTSLTTAPELPATTLASECYSSMFQDCTALTTAPELPATTLVDYCYDYMFYGCIDLTTAPKLPATTLADYCYSGMFDNCTSLTVAPELPATTLAYNCYQYMFSSCGNLNYVKCLATNISANNCTYNWLNFVSPTGTFVKPASMTSWTTGISGIPSGWNIVNDYSQDYLTTEALESGTISFNIWKGINTDMITSISYSTDNGLTWNTTNNIDNKSEHLTISVNVNEGDKVLWKGNAQLMGYNDSEEGDYIGSFFSSDCEFDVEGNVMSLLYSDNFENLYILKHAGQFTCLFYDYYESTECKVVNASNLILPATVLTNCCYYNMFAGCTSLTSAPELPATTLAIGCYGSMFVSCTNLITAPNLPATTLASNCYQYMFQNCTNLTTAPIILPATKLANYCYECMFYGCTSLTTAPELPAIGLTLGCYVNMFDGCTNLNYIKTMFTTTPSTIYTNNWVKGVAATGTFVRNVYATWNVTGVNGIPTGWTVKDSYSNRYLTTEALEDGTISFNIWKDMGTDMITSISYSTDDGETWITTNNTNNKIRHLAIDVNVNEGDKVLWKGNAKQTGHYDEDDYEDYVGSFFSSDCKFNVEGNVMSLLYGDNFENLYVLKYTGQFARLFSSYDEENECKVVNASNLTLPTTILADNCYAYMFEDCTNLTTAPELPARTLADRCYSNMFAGCTALVTAPELPAITLAEGCYSNMFRRCTSLITVLKLPATTLANNCYSSMFYGCTALTVVPELPATILARDCYNHMFCNCTSLIAAPELPATILTSLCYCSMFQGCTSLMSAPELPATTLAYGCYIYMFQDCTALTTAPELPARTLAGHCYSSMFYGCTALTAVPEILPATILANSCYDKMFFGCTALATTPELPATTLADFCYQSMFNGCTALTSVSELPATTLTNYCYNQMFYGCTALTMAPEILPATTLASSCYAYMFKGCINLTTVPEILPATILANSCYQSMFNGCRKLITAPKLPATTLELYCYNYMFSGCTRLNYIKAMFTTTPNATYTNNWVSGVPSTGTFVKNSAATWTTTGANGVPTGWTVQTASS